jgi:hypothetical protein
MKYAVQMGSGAMIYIPSFIKIGSGVQRLIEGIHRQQGDFISLLLLSLSNLKQVPPCNLTNQRVGMAVTV